MLNWLSTQRKAPTQSTYCVYLYVVYLWSKPKRDWEAQTKYYQTKTKQKQKQESKKKNVLSVVLSAAMSQRNYAKRKRWPWNWANENDSAAREAKIINRVAAALKAALPIRAQRSRNTIKDELSWAEPRWSEVSQNEMVVGMYNKKIHANIHISIGLYMLACNCEQQQQNKLTRQEVKWRQRSAIMK